MTLWIVLGVMSLLAVAFLAWPLFRGERQFSALLAVVIVLAVGASAGLYHYLGSPGVPSGASAAPEVTEMVAALATRLENNPDDVNGWKMLGRSYESLQQFDESVAAYEKAIELEQAKNPQTLITLAIILMGQQTEDAAAQASGLFENALALAPNDPNALFYAGAAAANRGNTDLAADRWEILLERDPPENIRTLLSNKIEEWRGVTVEPMEALPDFIRVAVSVASDVTDVVPSDTTVFIIARDPAQPSPPIAVARRKLLEFPSQVVISDRDAMIPGRPLSAFREVEIVARVSLSGAPAAQSGDWFGSTVIDRSEDQTVSLEINQVVP